uniref:Secreted protein n=1 Tax=Angiostrongylus cantonensis TaxID=6313 RepID=A0A0K0D7S0_ANGCA
MHGGDFYDSNASASARNLSCFMVIKVSADIASVSTNFLNSGPYSSCEGESSSSTVKSGHPVVNKRNCRERNYNWCFYNVSYTIDKPIVTCSAVPDMDVVSDLV